MKLVTSPLLAAMVACSALMAPAYAENPYYANDIDAAVRDAERNGPNMNYVGNRWYNRSTSKSFDFPKLLNTEMEKEVVEGALDSTAAGPGDEPPERESPLQLNEDDIAAADEQEIEALKELTFGQEEESLTVISIPTEQTNESVFRYVESIEYNSDTFSGRATDITSDVSTSAYITPQ